jgi:ATP-binding cassette subfamily C protein
VAPLLAVLLLGPWLLRRGGVSAGELVGAVTYLTTQLLPAIRVLTGTVAGYWTQLGVALERLAETGAPPPAAPPAGGTPRGHELRLESVTFAYGPHADPVLRDLTLTVPEGDHLAIVGASGIGKSTMADLLAGIAVPTRGRVLLGGAPVGAIDPAHRCAMIALIPQEAYVFAATLRDNLTCLAPGTGQGPLDDAVHRLGLGPLLARCGGYDVTLDDPAALLSAGERQLIALARVYLSSAPVVILDEATANLDPVAEEMVGSGFADRPGTLIVVAHRITAARRARRVLLLDEAGARLGTHVELVAAQPAYAALVDGWDIAGTGRKLDGAPTG